MNSSSSSAKRACTGHCEQLLLLLLQLHLNAASLTLVEHGMQKM
jgi:hypothetical protein